jgi:hypothetical protein
MDKELVLELRALHAVLEKSLDKIKQDKAEGWLDAAKAVIFAQSELGKFIIPELQKVVNAEKPQTV